MAAPSACERERATWRRTADRSHMRSKRTSQWLQRLEVALFGLGAVCVVWDSFFRPLQEIRIGDDIRLSTSHGEFWYRVRRALVVDPEDVWVLDSLPRVNLTLITCFPFSYVGHAPRRFVVQAEKVQAVVRGAHSSAQ